MRKLFLFLVISGFYTGISAQKLGYIRTDSAYISCDIFPQKAAQAAKICYYRFYPAVKTETATPNQIQGYGYGKIDYISYSIKSGNGTEKKFLQAIVQGDSPVYYLREKSGKRFYIVSSTKELVELKKENGEYKQQLAEHFGAPPGIIPLIHSGYSKHGIIRAVKNLKETNLVVSNNVFENHETIKKGKSLKEVRKFQLIKPLISISFQLGVTFQRLPLNLQARLPYDWDKFKSSSISYSLAAEIPLLKYYPVSYYQEICFNKFVNDYRRGSIPPDYQLIQDFSVLSLPAMLRYTFGRKKVNGFVNVGVQMDISMNKNNLGWLILYGDDYGPDNIPVIFEYLSYQKFQPGITFGFGVKYKIKQKMALSSEFRYSSINRVLPEKSGLESQYSFKAGITYSIFKQKKLK